MDETIGGLKKGKNDLRTLKQSRLNIDQLTEEQMNAEFEKGYSQTLNGNTVSAKETFAKIRKDYNI